MKITPTWGLRLFLNNIWKNKELQAYWRKVFIYSLTNYTQNLSLQKIHVSYFCSVKCFSVRFCNFPIRKFHLLFVVFRTKVPHPEQLFNFWLLLLQQLIELYTAINNDWSLLQRVLFQKYHQRWMWYVIWLFSSEQKAGRTELDWVPKVDGPLWLLWLLEHLQYQQKRTHSSELCEKSHITLRQDWDVQMFSGTNMFSQSKKGSKMLCLMSELPI